jgi:hypothetical protein
VFHPQHRDRSRIRLSQPENAFHGRGLACAIWAEHAKDLAAPDVKGHAVDSLNVPVPLVQIIYSNG